MTIISHPKEDNKRPIALLEHVHAVGELTQNDINDSRLAEIGKIVGLTHDLPKSTQKFQQYLTSEERFESPHNHAPSASLIATTCAYYTNIDFTTEEILLVYYTTYNHHGHATKSASNHFYNNVYGEDEYLLNKLEDRLEQIKETESGEDILLYVVNQLIDKEDVQSVSSFMQLVREFSEDFKEEIQHDYLPGQATDKLPSKHMYEQYIKVWSALAKADISHSSRQVSNVPVEKLYNTDITEYISKISTSDKINEYREKARQEVLETFEQIDVSETNIFNLTLPTGMGKTLTGMTAATVISEKTEYNTSRIIYALPYTSIIDQTETTLSDMMNIKCSHSTKLVKDHHLADTISYSTDDEGEFIGNSWFGGVVLTTFVQLFESVLYPSRTDSTKIPQIQDSVIIIDEPQAIPYQWWPLIRRVTETLCNKYNVKVVSMTATPPYILQQSNSLNSTNLIEGDEEYFSLDIIERVRYELDESVTNHDKQKTIPTLKNDILSDVNSNSQVLTIVNTINTANSLTKKLISASEIEFVNANNKLRNYYRNNISISFTEYLQQSSDGGLLCNLTSRHRPKDRKHLIEAIKNISERPIAVVSTQILEAGVDIDFEIVNRDVAQLSSIAQAAGRCNRDATKDIGTVRIFELEGKEGSQPPSKQVYSEEGLNVIEQTKDVLSNQTTDGTLTQKQVDYDCVKKYYTKLKQSIDGGYEDYVRFYNEMNMDELQKLSMIDSTQNYDIIVYDNDMKQDIRRIKLHFEKYEFDNAKNILDELSTITVSVPAYTEKEQEVLSKVELLDPTEHNQTRACPIDNEFYSMTYGFIIPDTTAEGRIL